MAWLRAVHLGAACPAGRACCRGPAGRVRRAARVRAPGRLGAERLQRSPVCRWVARGRSHASGLRSGARALARPGLRHTSRGQGSGQGGRGVGPGAAGAGREAGGPGGGRGLERGCRLRELVVPQEAGGGGLLLPLGSGGAGFVGWGGWPEAAERVGHLVWGRARAGLQGQGRRVGQGVGEACHVWSCCSALA